MQPLRFECSKVIPKSAATICAEIADLSSWREFGGYGLLPGIERANYETRTGDMVGSRIQVHNRDGSQHVEEILAWDDGVRVVMQLCDFTPPLSRLATHFVEEWNFETVDGGVLVTRKFQMFPTQPMARPLLWSISLLFRKAIARHLDQMAG